MPTVLTVDGLRVMIYTLDHRPAHVHVFSAGREKEAILILNCPDGPLFLREVRGFTLVEVNAIEKKLRNYLARLCRQWENIHSLP